MNITLKTVSDCVQRRDGMPFQDRSLDRNRVEWGFACKALLITIGND